MVGKTGRYKFNDSIFNLMKLFESGILLKNYRNLRSNITSKFPSDNIRKLSFSFFTYLLQTKIWRLVYRFDLNN